MELASSVLFSIGVILVAISFAAFLGHAVLLANGRRAFVLVRTPQPAFATGAVTGSFATARARSAGEEPELAASPTSLSGPATLIATVAFVALATSLIMRAVLVGRGPWGTLFEFTAAFATSIVGGYLLLSRRYPIRPGP